MKTALLSIAMLGTASHAANCPVSECDYLDPQYKAAFDARLNCVNSILGPFNQAMNGLAILYPRFGIAWRSQDAEINNATSTSSPENPQFSASIDEAHRRFEDRILRTAEPESLEIYNLWQLKIKQQMGRCGPMPEPPQRRP